MDFNFVNVLDVLKKKLYYSLDTFFQVKILYLTEMYKNKNVFIFCLGILYEVIIIL